MSCQLSNIISGQIFIAESGRPLQLYTNLVDIVFPYAGEVVRKLKPYSNLYVIENIDNRKNIYPTGLGFVLNSGLPPGIKLHNFNTLTGIPLNTGKWKVATNYTYSGINKNFTKIFYINVYPSGTIRSNPLFNTVIDSHGAPIFPILPGAVVFDPKYLTGNGQSVFPTDTLFPSGTGITGFFSGSSGVGSQTPFSSEGQFILIDENNNDNQVAPFDPANGQTTSEEVGGQKGDPSVSLRLPIAKILTDPLTLEITGGNLNCSGYKTNYLDTRARVENYFLGIIGGDYVCVDTETENYGVAKGIIRAVKFSRGTVSANSLIEKSYTTYILSRARNQFENEISQGNTHFMDLFSKHKNQQGYINITAGGIQQQTLDPTLFALWNFDISQNIGIGNISAFNFNWSFHRNQNSTNSDEFLEGGKFSVQLGELYRFDKIGGALIDNMNFIYNTVYKNSPKLPIENDIQAEVAWENWGSSLKTAPPSRVFKYFNGLHWLFSTNINPVGCYRLDNTGVLIQKASNINLEVEGECSEDPCPPCDPTCPGFDPANIANLDFTIGCCGSVLMPRYLCECYGGTWSAGPCPCQTAEEAKKYSLAENKCIDVCGSSSRICPPDPTDPTDPTDPDNQNPPPSDYSPSTTSSINLNTLLELILNK
jgi:hypothetical protein